MTRYPAEPSTKGEYHCTRFFSEHVSTDWRTDITNPLTLIKLKVLKECDIPCRAREVRPMKTFILSQFYAYLFNTVEDRCKGNQDKGRNFLPNAKKASFIGILPEKFWASIT